uniref:Uncharacterized protein LOC111107295 n=1 Tax=Crassostrea virginica TaxID=6565 RepID=A0A8B8B4K6_CRAVI|nr:uncharacterized protein LOC111107295 [Crassostrea virginica]
MMDFTSQSLGAPAPGPRLNQSGMDHVGAGLSSPFQESLSKTPLDASVEMTVFWETSTDRQSCQFFGLDMADLTIEETSYQTDNPTILSLSFVLAGLVFVSLVLLLVLFKENITSCKVHFSSVKIRKLQFSGSESERSQELHHVSQIEPPDLVTGDDTTVYCTINLDDEGLPKELDKMEVKPSRDDHDKYLYNILKRNYGNRLNSEENECSHHYDGAFNL